MEENGKKELPQDRWNREHNYIVKSFRMYRDVADRFNAACKGEGRRQSTVIQELMEGYIWRQTKLNKKK